MNKQQALTILGLSGNPSQDEVKKAYRKLAKKYHPDINKNSNSNKKFKEVNDAYEYLKDPSKFQGTNDFFKSSGSAASGASFAEMFESFFNAASRQQSRVTSINPAKKPYRFKDLKFSNVHIDFQQLLGLKPINLKYRIKAVNDWVKDPNNWKQCKTCNGTGVLTKKINMAGRILHVQDMCPKCKGEGWLKNIHFQGSKFIHKEKQLKVKVDINKLKDFNMFIRGKGSEGFNAPNSNLYIQFNLQAPKLDRLNNEELNKLKELLNKI